MFNSGEDGKPLLTTVKGGTGNGLEIMLDIQQDEYLPVWGETGMLPCSGSPSLDPRLNQGPTVGPDARLRPFPFLPLSLLICDFHTLDSLAPPSWFSYSPR